MTPYRIFVFSVVLVIFLGLASSPAIAIQDPLDQGDADSLFVVVSQPRLGVDLFGTVELYCFNDVQSVIGTSIAMSWTDPSFELDSAVFSPAATDAFTIFRFGFYKGNADSSNVHQLFQCAAGGFAGDGLPAGDEPKLLVTYYFTIDGWAADESFCVNLESFAATSLVDPTVGEYTVNWRAETCVSAGPDGDGDGVGDEWDNCLTEANPGQEDFDADDIGDICDLCTDSDDDGLGNPGFPVNTCDDDNCPEVSNPGQADIDADAVGDECDNCLEDHNPDQADLDGDGVGDVCESDCCEGRVGDANGVGGDEPTIGDVSVMIDAKFIAGVCEGTVACLAEADINQSGSIAPTCGDVTIADISILIDYLFITGASLGLPDCP